MMKQTLQRAVIAGSYARSALAVLACLILLPLAALMAGCQTQSRPAGAVGAVAPEFQLHDAQAADGAAPVALSELVRRGPVVVIFHRGLFCPICQMHLTDIAARIAEFRQAGMQIVAIGPDEWDFAREAAQAVGPYPFPLLCDPDDRTARAFGLERGAGILRHGTFVVDQQRRIRWAGAADHPVGTTDELLAAGRALAPSR